MTENTLLYTTVSYCSVDTQIPPLIGRLFVCLWWFPCFRSVIQDFFFVSFINNMQVQKLLWSLKLTVMCISSTVVQSCSKIFFFFVLPALTGKLIALVSFSAVTFSPSPPLLLSPLSSALREPTVLTIFRRLVDAWLQCCVVFYFYCTLLKKKVWKVAFNFS